MEAAERTRNICILAHVDHGKTTLADHLIAAAGDGVLHPKQAGKLRYLDFKDDEQQRCITIKSASIALSYKHHLVNLIDSPGHIDFCGEVSTAVRLSDGALVLVDACEGVQTQTHAVLRQAWLEMLTPCLVLNKVDRLILELKLSPLEAYRRMQQIIAEVNNIVSGFRAESYLSRVEDSNSGELVEEENLNSFVDFSPVAGNVAFSSALDGWAFRTQDFVEVCARRMNVRASELGDKMWGEFFYVGKKGIVSEEQLPSSSKRDSLKPLFVQLVLENLWQVYSSLEKGGGGGVEILNRVISSMKLSVPERELRGGDNNNNTRSALQAVMSRWLPISDKLLDMVLQCTPSPAQAQAYRVDHLMPARHVSSSGRSSQQQLLEEIELTRKAVEECDASPEAPCVVYISKMFAVPVSMIPPAAAAAHLQAETEDECFLAFARVFSGVLTTGERVFVLSELHDPVSPDKMSFEAATVGALFVMMGQGLKLVEKAAAGNVVAIQGLGESILKTATLSSSPSCWPLAALSFQTEPLVRVAVEPSNPSNLGQLLKGLKLLNRADPMVQVSHSKTGEYVLSAAGEVHLELCLKELRERFARVDFDVSAPLVAFRESIEDTGEWEEKVGENLTPFNTPNKRYTGFVEVRRLPAEILQAMERSDLVEAGEEALASDLLAQVGAHEELARNIWSCCGNNLLLRHPDASPELLQSSSSGSEDSSNLGASIITGFQLACGSGPLCKEPLWGLAFRIQVTSCDFSRTEKVIHAIRVACGEAVLRNHPRLVEGMYSCEVSASSSFLGQMYGVLARRRARVIKEELIEGRDLFRVQGFMPVAESFGFSKELRNRTSGSANAQLRFSHWEEVLSRQAEDEEEEESGAADELGGLARRLVDAVRRRKGLAVKENLVRHAAKQRTLAKKV